MTSGGPPSATRAPAPPPWRLPVPLGVFLVLSICLATPLWSQEDWGREGTGRGLVVYAHILKHQPATEAMPLVLSMLSSEGTVELRPASNTLVIRDSLAAISRIVPMLRSFDHPARGLEISLWLVAGDPVATFSPPVSGVPPPEELLAQLRRHLSYASYRLLAASEVRGLEGDEVAFDLPSGHRIRFRLGTVLGEQRVRLHEFEVARQGRGGEEESLLRTNLFLWLDRTTVLSMAGNRGDSRALMVVVRCRLAPEEPGS